MANIKLANLKPEKTNPRKITKSDLENLKKSIQDFPKMMELRPIIIDKTSKILAGHQKVKALVELGYEEIPDTWVKKASDLTEEERQAFIVKDNVHAGTWDTDLLLKNWDETELKDWGLELKMEEPKQMVSFGASKGQKGCTLKVSCDNSTIADELYERLVKEGHQVTKK